MLQRSRFGYSDSNGMNVLLTHHLATGGYVFCHVFLINCCSWNPAYKSHWQLLRRARSLLRTGILFFVAVDREPLHQCVALIQIQMVFMN